MENEIYGYVYLITNKINGKQYVGQTTTTIKERFGWHCSSKNPVISKAINKYGKKNFIIQELAVAYDQEKLTFLEGMYMSWFNTLAPNGYNIARIINGNGKHSEETKIKMSVSANTPEKLKMSVEQGMKSRGRVHKNSKSKYCGVSINGSSWESFSRQNNKRIRLGSFSTEIEAAQARDIAELKYLGNNAILNLPKLKEQYLKGEINPKKLDQYRNKKSNCDIRGIFFSKYNQRWIVDKVNIKIRSFKYKEDAIAYLESELLK